MARPSRFYIDTKVAIAIIEASGSLTPGQTAFIGDVDKNRIDAVTSELTLAECLVKPMADRNAGRVAAYLAFLDGRTLLSVLPVSRPILVEAARLRAETGIKLPDGIHAATASAANCDVFLTNDRRMKTSNITIQQWDRMGTIMS